MTTPRTERLHRLFRPRSIAVVGASPKGGYGLTTLSNVRAGGFAGALYVVHPTRDEVDGIRAYPRLADLPEVPDAVAVAVPAKAVPGVLAEAAELGVGGAVVYASGFAEVGGEGARLQEELVAISEASGLPVIGPNCLGLASYRGHALLWGITVPLVHSTGTGTLAIAAQSGNMSLTTMHSGRLPEIAYGVSLGNQAAVDISDVLELYLEDPQVRVVALIMEGLSDPGRFRRLAQSAAAADVAIVALKIGRSAVGEQATVAHTGTLAGTDAAYDALFRQTGVIRVEDLDELVAAGSYLAGDVRAATSRLGIFASSGGECGLVADLSEEYGVPLARLTPETERALGALLPEYGHVSNPFDLTAGGWGQVEIYAAAARALAADPGVDVVAFVGDAPTHAAALADSGWPAMVEGAGQACDLGKPVALVTTTTDTDPDLAALCARHGVRLLPGVRTAVRILGLAAARAEQVAALPTAEDHAPATAATTPLYGGTLSETEAKDVLSQAGLPVPPGGFARDVEEAVALAERIGYPVVCKVDADGLVHKSDIGGVVVGLGDRAAVGAAVASVTQRATSVVGSDAVRGVRIERAVDVRDGIELIVGGRNDAAGALVVVGAGGVLAELLADTEVLLWPFDAAEVRRCLGRLRVSRLLAGYRGAPPVDIDAVGEAVIAVGRLLAAHPEIAELDVNPLLCRSDGATALDGLIRVRD